MTDTPGWEMHFANTRRLHRPKRFRESGYWPSDPEKELIPRRSALAQDLPFRQRNAAFLGFVVPPLGGKKASQNRLKAELRTNVLAIQQKNASLRCLRGSTGRCF